MTDLQPHVGTRRIVRIEREQPGQPFVFGYVVAATPDLALVHAFDDFEPDGYAILRTADIIGVRSDEHERLWDRMLAGESLLDGLDAPPTVDLSSMAAAIRSAAAAHDFLIVRCEDFQEPIEDFYFAQVADIGKDRVLLRYVDGLARWREPAACVLIDEITMIEIDTPYLRRFARYVPEPPISLRNTSPPPSPPPA